MFSSKPFGWAILLFVLLLLPNIMVACLGSDLDGNPLKRVAYLIMSILLVLLPSVFMRWRRYFLWMGVFFIFSPIEIGHVVFCKMPISTGLITSLFHTNFKETFELVGAIYYYLIPLVALIFFYFPNPYKARRNAAFPRLHSCTTTPHIPSCHPTNAQTLARVSMP
mgnify:CR=1 FL=1